MPTAKVKTTTNSAKATATNKSDIDIRIVLDAAKKAKRRRRKPSGDSGSSAAPPPPPPVVVQSAAPFSVSPEALPRGRPLSMNNRPYGYEAGPTVTVAAELPEIVANRAAAQEALAEELADLQAQMSALQTQAGVVPPAPVAAPAESAPAEVPTPAPVPDPEAAASSDETVAPAAALVPGDPSPMDAEPNPPPVSDWSQDVSGLMNEVADIRKIWSDLYGPMTDADFTDMLREQFGDVINAPPQLFRDEIRRHKQALNQRIARQGRFGSRAGSSQDPQAPSTSRASPVAKRTRLQYQEARSR